MRILISEQCLYFSASILFGVLAALFYELFHFLRALIPHHAIVVSVEDFIYCSTCAVLFIFLTYALSYGEIRWFGIFGALSGAFLYRFALGRKLKKYIDRLADALRRLCARVVKSVIKPLIMELKKFTARLRAYQNIRTDHRIRKKILSLPKRRF